MKDFKQRSDVVGFGVWKDPSGFCEEIGSRAHPRLSPCRQSRPVLLLQASHFPLFPSYFPTTTVPTSPQWPHQPRVLRRASKQDMGASNTTPPQPSTWGVRTPAKILERKRKELGERHRRFAAGMEEGAEFKARRKCFYLG